MLTRINNRAALRKRIKDHRAQTAGLVTRVDDILSRIRQTGDAALKAYTLKFDGVDLPAFRVPTELIAQLGDSLDDHVKSIILKAAENIRHFHELQLPEDKLLVQPDGTICEWRWRPLQRAGAYVPGGRYPLISTLLMNVIPAQVAGVPEIVVATPPSSGPLPNENILAVCGLLEIDEVYTLGGAQAIGALAYGTETIKPVQRITGPGNAWVSTAKARVSGAVGIDMVAGPTEVVILADDSANAKVVAADLISQAEHDPLAWPVLITTDAILADAVDRELPVQLDNLDTAIVATAALKNNGFIFIATDFDSAIAAVNEIAPEHLCLQIADAEAVVPKVISGAIFVGAGTPVAWGDYWAGANHTLPTGGTAVYRGPLSVFDFITPFSVVKASGVALNENGPAVRKLAELEGLSAHALSIQLRESENE